MKDLKRISKLSGIAYLIIFITGIYANFFVLVRLVELENPTLTVINLSTEKSAFELAIFGFVIMLIFDLVLVWGLYKLFRSVSWEFTLMASTLRLINVLIFGVALYHLIAVFHIVTSIDSITVHNQFLETKVINLLNDFNNIWLIGLLFFAFHLALLAYLVWRSSAVPKWLGVLLMIAAIGYVVDSFAQLFLLNYPDYESFFALAVIVPGVIGELTLTFWLLFRSNKFAELPYLSNLNRA
ncbi:DUF4386 domain-containing protein [Aurantibacter crassamenti]|uniref:DUF4386 domain-containing protein n=1 Tax=Aurantibacter crassamenti TaxID=1837375 RepID=UPI001939D718|nr:DUF4386 domain-containing protein [Aurantibacter crassamenti]MBM1107788.1 DUF4386 domain-containing protein [Aurantibacter crassamenti]